VITVPELLSQQALLRPDAIGVRGPHSALNLAALTDFSNRLAQKLLELNPGREAPVAVHMDHSPESVAACISAWRAGLPYLPIDPQWPVKRVAEIWADCRPVARVTYGEIPKAAGLPKIPEIDLSNFFLPSHQEPAEKKPASVQPFQTQSGDLAYIIYTSGSSGKSRGVEIEHRSLQHLVSNLVRAWEITPLDRVSLLSGVGFDASVLEIWSALSAGASLHIPDSKTHSDVRELIQWICREQITLCFMPTPMAELALELPWPAECSLRLLITGGDKLHFHPRRPQPFQLVNAYGPTENTVISTMCTVPTGKDILKSPSIGKPLSGVEAYVVDEYLKPVGVGGLGELALAGAGLARGYRNLPEDTARVFVTASVRTGPPIRLYRTGDLVRLSPDGDFEFMGRVDDQIKIRGFRMDPSEIESAILADERVSQAVVIADHRDPLSPRLVAYLVLHVGHDKFNADSLRLALRETLPRPMVPSDFHVVTSIPVNSSGKFDRRAVFLLKSAERTVDDSPKDETERELLKLWSSLFAHSQISPVDNFFDVGGDSLTAVRLITAVEKRWKMVLPMPVLYANPTVRMLTALIRGNRDPGVDSCAVPMQPNGARTPIFFVAGAGGGVHWFRDLAARLDPEQPFFGLDVLGFSKGQPADYSVEAVATKFILAMKRVQPNGPYLLGGYSSGGTIAWEMAQQLLSMREKAVKLILVEAYNPQMEPVGASRWVVYCRNVLHFRKADLLRYFHDKFHWIVNSRSRATLSKAIGSDMNSVNTAQIQADAAYHPKPYAGEIVLVLSEQQPLSRVKDPLGGWKNLILGVCQTMTVPGDHYRIWMPPQVDELVRCFKSILTALERKSTASVSIEAQTISAPPASAYESPESP
jgi:amino acid adenylation domain-containing protein